MTKDAADLSKLPMGSAESIADLFLAASQELAKSDARIYRSVDRHLRRTREILAQEDLREWAQQEPKPARQLDYPSHLLQGAPSYERQPRKILEHLCRVHGIRRYSRMSKAVMITQLKIKGVEPPPIPLQAFTKTELLALIEDLTNVEGCGHES